MISCLRCHCAEGSSLDTLPAVAAWLAAATLMD